MPRSPIFTLRAFTLLEVLVALAIFAVAAVVLGATYVNVLANYSAAAARQEHEQDLRFVRVPLLSEPDRRKAEAGGELALSAGGTARWTAAVAETRVADLFRVHWRCEIRTTSLPWVREENFLLLRPTWSDPAAREKLREASRQRLSRREQP
jgi:general secretion pathway protein I